MLLEIHPGELRMGEEQHSVCSNSREDFSGVESCRSSQDSLKDEEMIQRIHTVPKSAMTDFRSLSKTAGLWDKINQKKLRREAVVSRPATRIDSS